MFNLGRTSGAPNLRTATNNSRWNAQDDGGLLGFDGSSTSFTDSLSGSLDSSGDEQQSIIYFGEQSPKNLLTEPTTHENSPLVGEWNCLVSVGSQRLLSFIKIGPLQQKMQLAIYYMLQDAVRTKAAGGEDRAENRPKWCGYKEVEKAYQRLVSGTENNERGGDEHYWELRLFIDNPQNLPEDRKIEFLAQLIGICYQDMARPPVKSYFPVNPYLSRSEVSGRGYQYVLDDPMMDGNSCSLGGKPHAKDKQIIGRGGSGSVEKYTASMGESVVKKTVNSALDDTIVQEIAKLTAKMEIKLQQYQLNILLNHPKRIRYDKELRNLQLAYVGKTVDNLRKISAEDVDDNSMTPIAGEAFKLLLQWQALGGLGIDAVARNFLVREDQDGAMTVYRVDLDIDFWVMKVISHLHQQFGGSDNRQLGFANAFKFCANFPHKEGNLRELPTFFSLIGSEPSRTTALIKLCCDEQRLAGDDFVLRPNLSRMQLFFQAQALFGVFINFLSNADRRFIDRFLRPVALDFFDGAAEYLREERSTQFFWHWNIDTPEGEVVLRLKFSELIRNFELTDVAAGFVDDFVAFILAWRDESVDKNRMGQNIAAVNKFMTTLRDSHELVLAQLNRGIS